MADGFKPGDVLIDGVSLASPRGSLDMTPIFMSANIYESIFNPGVVAHIEVLDTEDYIGTLKLSGDEIVKISFLVPGGQTIDYTLNLHSIEDVDAGQYMKAKIYKLICLSKETFTVRANPITKSYNTQISNIISDVFKNFIGSSKNIEIEATKGLQKYISPNIKPLDLIHKLRKRAVSIDNKSSNFVFFENRDGFKFKTIEGLFKQDVIKEFKQDDTVGRSIYSEDHNNIIAYEIPRQSSSLDKIGMGALNQKVQTYDIRTKKYVTESKTPIDALNSITSDFFKAMFGKTPGKSIFIQKDSTNPETHLSDAISNKNSYLASLMQSQVNIEVPGDTALHAGGMVYCHIPKKASTTGMIGADMLVDGKFLIAKLAHIIKRQGSLPRYTVSMELIHNP